MDVIQELKRIAELIIIGIFIMLAIYTFCNLFGIAL